MEKRLVTNTACYEKQCVTFYNKFDNNPLENPHVYTAIKLAHALGVSVEDIFKL